MDNAWYCLVPGNVLNCTALHFTALYCLGLYWTALHWASLHCTSWYSFELQCPALHSTERHYSSLHCTAWYCFEPLSPTSDPQDFYWIDPRPIQSSSRNDCIKQCILPSVDNRNQERWRLLVEEIIINKKN